MEGTASPLPYDVDAMGNVTSFPPAYDPRYANVTPSLSDLVPSLPWWVYVTLGVVAFIAFRKLTD